MGEYTPIGMIVGGLIALSWALKKYREVRDGLIVAIWESEYHRQKMSKAIEEHPKVMEMEGRIKELSRAGGHPDESSFDWGAK